MTARRFSACGCCGGSYQAVCIVEPGDGGAGDRHASSCPGCCCGPRPAAADTQPPVPATPVTVSTDPLPTVQINGVVWAQIVVGRHRRGGPLRRPDRRAACRRLTGPPGARLSTAASCGGAESPAARPRRVLCRGSSPAQHVAMAVPRWRHVRSLRLDQGPRRPGRRVPAVDATDGAAHADYNVAPTKQVVTVVQRHPARRRGQPRPGHHRAHPAAGPLGPGAVLGEGRQGWRSHDQRTIGDGRREAGVPPGVERAALPDPGRWLVRVAARQGSQAALLHALPRRQLAGHGRAVGVLEAQGRPGRASTRTAWSPRPC